MLIFVRMQNCVKWLTDTCFPVQNTQNAGGEYSILHKGGAAFSWSGRDATLHWILQQHDKHQVTQQTGAGKPAPIFVLYSPKINMQTTK